MKVTCGEAGLEWEKPVVERRIDRRFALLNRMVWL